MLALCVNMQYTLSRWRFEKPEPPYEVAGVVSRWGDRVFLTDAHGSVELSGVTTLETRAGDWIAVSVREPQPMAERLLISGWRELVAQTQEWSPATGRAAVDFAKFVEDVREFFLSAGLHQVFTPGLVVCPGLEPSLEPFKTERWAGSARESVYLPTSPEIHLKKALALGWTDIFEIKNCYRNNENSPAHANEFLMLEWYRAFANLDLVISDLGALMLWLKKCGWIAEDAAVSVTDFAVLFREILDFDLRPSTSRDELAGICNRLGILFAASDTFADLFHRLMMDVIEPALVERGPLVIRRFPPSMAALARLTGEGWADRFEFYWKGFEIANAFFEVTDPNEQIGRWSMEKAERARLGTSVVPEDPGLIAALGRGVPPTAGIALGVERLFMAACDVQDIRDLRLFR